MKTKTGRKKSISTIIGGAAMIGFSHFFAPSKAHLNESTLRRNYDISYTTETVTALCILIEKDIVSKTSGQYWTRNWLESQGFPTKTSKTINERMSDLTREFPGCPIVPRRIKNGWRFPE